MKTENFIIKKFDNLNEIVDQIIELENKIFDKPYKKDDLLKRAKDKTDLVALVAYSSHLAVGYKIGYSLTPNLFYSWNGGVSQDHRGSGIAKALMLEQHKIVKSLGYTNIRTHTHNNFREMLIMNIKAGFSIIGTYNNLNEHDLTIMLEKELS